jgi:hypothetical protein
MMILDRHHLINAGGISVYNNNRLSFILLSVLAAVLFIAGAAMAAYADDGRGPGHGGGGPPPSDNFTGGRPQFNGTPPSDNFTGGRPPSDNMTDVRPPDGSDNMTGGRPSMWDSSDNMTATVLSNMATILGIDVDTLKADFDKAVSQTFNK